MFGRKGKQMVKNDVWLLTMLMFSDDLALKVESNDKVFIVCLSRS